MAKIVADDVIKKRNSKDKYDEDQLDALMKCMDDPMYFMENFMRIQHPTLGALPFHPYDYQFRIIDGLHNHRNVVICAGRQLGKTTCAMAYLLWYAMFIADSTVLIVANKLNQALEIMDRIRYAYQEMPNWIKAGNVEFNKGTLAFDNGSKILARATTSDAARGLSVSVLYCDEFSRVPPRLARAFLTSIAPTLSTGGRSIITSTPNDDEDQFALIWKGAIENTDEYGNVKSNGEGRNGYYPIKVTWREHPDRDEAWAKPYRETLGEAGFRAEFEAEFISQSDTLINPLKLAIMRAHAPAFYTGQVRWFRDPEPNKRFLVALDPSLGVERDSAAIQVFQIPEMIQIAEWEHNQAIAREQVRVLMQILSFIDQELRDNHDQMGDPEIYWTVENNSIGEAVLNIIEDTGEDKFPGNFVHDRKRKGQTRRFRKGMLTDNRKKLSACARIKSLIETDRMIVNSQNLIHQFKNFVPREASFGAKSGEHDDLVSASLLICRMLDVVLFWGAGQDDSNVLREIVTVDDDDAYEPMPMLVG